MCLYLCSTCSCKNVLTCCDVFWRDCCRTCNPLGILFNILLGFPGGLLVVLGGGLVTVVVHVVPGSYNHIVALWAHWSMIISRGRDAYSEDPNRRPRFWDCCAAACAEVYCCMTPFFVLATLIIPVWLLFMLLAIAFCTAISGGCAGCVGTNVGSWWPRVSYVLRSLDRQMALDAMRPDKAPVLTCLGDDPAQQLPTHAVPMPPAAQAPYQQPYHPQACHPHPQAARPAGGAAPPPPPPRDTFERAVADVTRDVATNLAVTGIRMFLGGASRPAATAPPPHVAVPQTAVPAVPRAVPRAVPVAVPIGGQAPARAVPVGRRVQ